jgi:hypothetical protein
MGTQLYGYTTDEHEYSVTVPETMISGDPELIIYMSAHGGGTVGEEYANNGWDYMITEAGETILEGSDLRSPQGRPAGHAEMALTLAGFLSAYGESFHYHTHYARDGWQSSEFADGYTETEAEWLAANYERLSEFSAEAEEH